jgi:MFS transporter, DHA1 family, inner membrane transport protein
MIAEPAGTPMPAATPVPGFALAVGLLAFANFVVVTTEFVVVGLLPAMASDLNISLAAAGWFATWFALAAALVGPPLTMLAARYDPRHVLVAGAIIFAAGNLAAALVPHHSVVVAVRLLQGTALPVFVSVAIVSGTRLAGAGREGWATSLVNIGVVAATVLGIPAGAMIAGNAGWPASFAVLAVLGLTSAILLAARFPRVAMVKPVSLRTEASLLWRPAFLAQLLLAGILFTAMFAGYTYVAAILGAAAGLDGAIIGWMLMGFGLAGVLGNWIAGRVVDRDPLAAMACVAVALALAMAAISFAGTNLALLVLLVGLWGAAHMAAFVFCQVSTMAAGREAPAFAMSLNISVCNLGIALGAFIGGQIVDRYGVGAIGYGGAALAVVAVLIAVAMKAAEFRNRNRERGLIGPSIRESNCRT